MTGRRRRRCHSWRRGFVDDSDLVTASVRVRFHRDRRVGQSARQRLQPLQLAASTLATGTALGAPTKGSAKSSTVSPNSPVQIVVGELRSVSGWMKSTNQSRRTSCGSCARFAGASLSAGLISASVTSVRKVPSIFARGQEIDPADAVHVRPQAENQQDRNAEVNEDDEREQAIGNRIRRQEIACRRLAEDR